MPITQAQITLVARQRVGNKVNVSVGENFVPDKAVESEMREQVMECCRLFGGSSAKKEVGFTTVAAPPLSAPASLVATPSASGGTLADGTYAYEVSSIRGNGECVPGGAQIATVTGPTGSVALSWPAVQGAEGYKVYGRLQGFYQLLAQVTVTNWTDTGIALPGSGPATNDGVVGAYQQNYDVSTYVGSDVLEIDEVLRSDAYRSDALVDYYMLDPRTGIPAVKGAFVDFGFQQMTLESQQQIERFSNADKFEWDTYTDGQGRLVLRLMPPPEQPIYVVVRYLSTNEGLASLPESARVPLEHAACTALLNCVMNRTDSEAPEAGQGYRERRIALDTIKGQRDYYEARYRRALARLRAERALISLTVMNFRIDIDQSDIDRLTRGFELAVAAQSSRTLEHLADVAVRSLSDLDRKLNHLVLSGLWTRTEVLPDGDGLSVTVYSEAETMVFFNKTSSSAGRVPSDRHFIQGDNLLEILEGGAKRHVIMPSEASILTLPGPDGGTVFRNSVQHPGVAANENVKQTGEVIEQGLDQVASDAADAISVEMI